MTTMMSVEAIADEIELFLEDAGVIGKHTIIQAMTEKLRVSEVDAKRGLKMLMRFGAASSAGNGLISLSPVTYSATA